MQLASLRLRIAWIVVAAIIPYLADIRHRYHRWRTLADEEGAGHHGLPLGATGGNVELVRIHVEFTTAAGFQDQLRAAASRQRGTDDVVVGFEPDRQHTAAGAREDRYVIGPEDDDPGLVCRN